MPVQVSVQASGQVLYLAIQGVQRTTPATSTKPMHGTRRRLTVFICIVQKVDVGSFCHIWHCDNMYLRDPRHKRNFLLRHANSKQKWPCDHRYRYLAIQPSGQAERLAADV